MLSNEGTPNTQTVDAYRATLNEMHARNLADRLVTYEHNPSPHEAPNPAHCVRIRRVVPLRPNVINKKQCEQHNQAVYTLGLQGEFTR
jgi:hypothetical protein